MSLLEPPLDPGDPARLRVEAGRTCDRLRSMALARLSARRPDGSSRADAAFAVAQQLADSAAELSGRPRREVPRLGDPAAGDVVAVCAQDLAESVSDSAAGGAPEAAAQACRAAVAHLVGLRRTL